MGILGDTAKGFVLLTVVVGVFLIFEFIAMNQIVLAILLLIGILIPICLVLFDFWKMRRTKKT